MNRDGCVPGVQRAICPWFNCGLYYPVVALKSGAGHSRMSGVRDTFFCWVRRLLGNAKSMHDFIGGHSGAEVDTWG